MQIQKFVTVVQRRMLSCDEDLFARVEHLFAIESHMSFEERVQLLTTATRLGQGFVACEVGSYLGASTSLLAVAAAMRGGHIHCVDTWDNRAMGEETPRDTFEEFRRNTGAYADLITIHRGESAQLAGSVPPTLDLLFLDGDHSYAAVRADLFAYAPKIKPGGILLLHDFTYDTVVRATREYLAARPPSKVMDLGEIHSLKGFQFL